MWLLCYSLKIIDWLLMVNNIHIFVLIEILQHVYYIFFPHESVCIERVSEKQNFTVVMDNFFWVYLYKKIFVWWCIVVIISFCVYHLLESCLAKNKKEKILSRIMLWIESTHDQSDTAVFRIHMFFKHCACLLWNWLCLIGV